MKRKLLLAIAILVAFSALTGCVYTADRSMHSAGSNLPSIALLSDNDAFINAVTMAAGEDYSVFATADLAEANAADVVFMYLPDPWDIADVTAPLVIYTDKPHIVIDGVSGVVVDKDDAARAAWDTLYTYPTHCTPIRTLTLVESLNSTGGQLYFEMLTAGKLMDKGLYCADAYDISAYDWTVERLSNVTVGLLDTIYAENTDLARAAFHALREAGRNDSVEVICAGLDDDILEFMAEDHWLMGAAIGADIRDVAAEMLKLAEKRLSTGETETVTIAPRAILSDDVFAELTALAATDTDATGTDAAATATDTSETNASETAATSTEPAATDTQAN